MIYTLMDAEEHLLIFKVNRAQLWSVHTGERAAPCDIFSFLHGWGAFLITVCVSHFTMQLQQGHTTLQL